MNLSLFIIRSWNCTGGVVYFVFSILLRWYCKRLHFSGANLSIQNNRGDTALHLCAYRGYIDIVKVFIQSNSNLFIKNNNERTPSDEAEGNNHHNTAELLRQNMIG